MFFNTNKFGVRLYVVNRNYFIMITTCLDSCIEISGTKWTMRTEGCTYAGEETHPIIAQRKAYLRAAENYCCCLETPAVVSSITEKGDRICKFNEPALLYLGVSREKAKSLEFSSKDFWQNLSDYWDYRQSLIQTAKAEACVRVLALSGELVGELLVMAKIVSPDSPVFLVQTI